MVAPAPVVAAHHGQLLAAPAAPVVAAAPAIAHSFQTVTSHAAPVVAAAHAPLVAAPTITDAYVHPAAFGYTLGLPPTFGYTIRK